MRSWEDFSSEWEGVKKTKLRFASDIGAAMHVVPTLSSQDTFMPMGPKLSRKLHKQRVNLRLSAESADFLRGYSAKSHCTISELAELIIREYRATEENYFTKSAAYFGFVNASLSLMIAAKLFEPELAPTGPLTGIKEDITRAAEKMFGPQPTSPFRWYCTDGDERLWSLYHAFAAHHLKRGDHVGSLDVR